MAIDLLPEFVRNNYEVHEWKHACAILKNDFSAEWDDLSNVLTDFRWYRSWVNVGGGRKSKISRAIDSELYKRGWIEKKFDTEILVDDNKLESPTHSVDCFKNRVALEIEWNNKDPFSESPNPCMLRTDHEQERFFDIGFIARAFAKPGQRPV